MRLRDIGDARLELEDVLSGRGESVPAAATAPRRFRIAGVAVALLVLGLIAGVLIVPALTPDPTPTLARYSIALPSKPSELVLDSPSGYSPPVAVSPDGHTVVFVAQNSAGERWLYARRADDGNVERLPGTSGAEAPFFSPDGKQVGYSLATRTRGLYAFSFSDSTTRQLTGEHMPSRGASWGPDGMVVFGDADQGLKRVPAEGGDAEGLTKPAEDERDHRWPQVLPDGKSILFMASMRDNSLEARILSLETREVTRIPIRGAFARYLPGGYLLSMAPDAIGRHVDLIA